MFDNIGGKIRKAAVALFVVGTMCSLFGAGILVAKELLVYGIVAVVLGIVLSWVLAWAVYCLGAIYSQNEYLLNKLITLQNYVIKADSD